MSEKKIRTRFAPSPTGYMHIGNLRTALYTYLVAKANDGTFILRIEDTDQERFVEGATEKIYATLKETGLIHDEGPDIGGEYGPYIQSERKGSYMKYADELVEKGAAYPCFCDKERLDKVRRNCQAQKLPNKYDGFCQKLTKEEIQEKKDAGIPFVIRQKMPTTGQTTFHDEVFGDITVENSTLEDLVLIKSDGMPTYNFANVIDDHLMGITHIVRGKEYLSSTPKYNLLYQSFGWDIPVYIHVSTVMKDKDSKLSKRDGDASYEDFKAKGYLTDAILNYIALVGWNPGTEREKFTVEELKEVFNVKGISKSPAIFDEAKMKWLNGEYIRAMSKDEFYEIARPYIKESVKNESVDLKKVSDLLQTRTDVLNDIPEQVDFFDSLPNYDPELYVHKKMKTNPENCFDALKAILPVLEEIEDWSYDEIHDKMFALVKELDVKTGRILWPLRVATSGKKFTPGGGIEIAYILGKQESIKRVQSGIELLSK